MATGSTHISWALRLRIESMTSLLAMFCTLSYRCSVNMPNVQRSTRLSKKLRHSGMMRALRSWLSTTFSTQRPTLNQRSSLVNCWHDLVNRMLTNHGHNKVNHKHDTVNHQHNIVTHASSTPVPISMCFGTNSAP